MSQWPPACTGPRLPVGPWLQERVAGWPGAAGPRGALGRESGRDDPVACAPCCSCPCRATLSPCASQGRQPSPAKSPGRSAALQQVPAKAGLGSLEAQKPVAGRLLLPFLWRGEPEMSQLGEMGGRGRERCPFATVTAIPGRQPELGGATWSRGEAGRSRLCSKGPICASGSCGELLDRFWMKVRCRFGGSI